MCNLFKTLTLIALVMTVAAGQAQEESTPPPPDSIKDYVLIPSDLIQVKVFQEDDLTREVSVSRNYTISLPLIGDVSVRDKTVREIEKEIRDLYGKDYLQNPQITIIILRYAERVVNVIGQVNQPGPVPFPQEKSLTLVEAIARAGGFSRLGNPKNVTLTRTDDTGQSRNYTIDVSKLLTTNSSSNAWMLRPNDVVFVREKIL
ncbi:periplasmic protein involved in polysaccharide export [Opitutaceae bacterium TAV1]|nr:periplasmic protein involved in polysaccharide export [Opitutaceae bacterium TAV1]